MTTELIAMGLIGALSLGHLWLMTGLFLNVLKKLDQVETKLMAQSEQFPHVAYMEMQHAAMTQHSPRPLDQTVPQTWMESEAS